MELLFLGTGAGLPSKGRNVSSLALKLLDELNEIWLFDCGEATQHQILKTSLKPRKIRKVFISHLHGDHIFGLPGFLSSRSFQIAEREDLTVFGPPGLRNYIQSSLKFSKSKLLYPLKIVELDPQGGKLQLNGHWTMEYLPLDHGTLSFGFRVIEPDQPGQLLMDKLAKYQVPNGPLLGQLKQGKQVQLPDGQILDGKDFIGPKKAGRIVTILGDSRPCSNSVILAKQADCLVHEATHRANEHKMAHQYYHSTSQQAANIAKQAQVKHLLLNHISARYLGQDIQQLQAEAGKTFASVKVVNDFDQISIKG
ncbi:ribonuclease Z [Ignavigranum ruoffiae]|uniref:ribonuclease Z n=1 Tax=Ignavigranum ruoffiae TaxID=89093 RepID=UPI003AFFF8B8